MFALKRINMGFSTLGKTTKFEVYQGYLIPKAPSKRLNSQLANFMKQNYQKIKEQNKDLKFGQLSKIVSTQFKALSESEKKKYISNRPVVGLDQKIKEHYDKFLEPLKSKQMSIYAYFTKTEGSKITGKSISENMKETASKYAQLTTDQKKKLQDDLEAYKKSFSTKIEALSDYKIPTSNISSVKDLFRTNYLKQNANSGKEWVSKFKQVKGKQLEELKKDFKKIQTETKQNIAKFVARHDLQKITQTRILKGISIDPKKKPVQKQAKSISLDNKEEKAKSPAKTARKTRSKSETK